MRYVYLILTAILLVSCFNPPHELSFDIDKQVFVGCDGPIRRLLIDNDSIVNGLLFEGGMTLSWQGQPGDGIPYELDITNIPDNFEFTKGGLPSRNKHYRFKPNCSYLVEKSGGGRPSAYIRIYTDSNRRVYKFIHLQGSSESLYH